VDGARARKALGQAVHRDQQRAARRHARQYSEVGGAAGTANDRLSPNNPLPARPYPELPLWHEQLRYVCLTLTSSHVLSPAQGAFKTFAASCFHQTGRRDNLLYASNGRNPAHLGILAVLMRSVPKAHVPSRPRPMSQALMSAPDGDGGISRRRPRRAISWCSQRSRRTSIAARAGIHTMEEPGCRHRFHGSGIIVAGQDADAWWPAREGLAARSGDGTRNAGRKAQCRCALSW